MITTIFPTYSYQENTVFFIVLNTSSSTVFFYSKLSPGGNRLTLNSLYSIIAISLTIKESPFMSNNPFIHARSAQDWVIGLLFAAYSSILAALFLILLSR